MVLDDGGEHDVVGSEAQPVREVVDRLGRVAADHHDVVAVARRPAKRSIASRASSYAPVARRDLYPAPRWTLEYHGRNSCTPRRDRGERAGGGRGVEVHVPAVFTVDAGNEQVVADERHREQEFGGGHDSSSRPETRAPVRGYW